MTEKNLPKIHIIGIGNLTRLDDGIAIHILEELRKETFPDNVKISDLGTGGIDIALALDGWSFGIIIDAVKMIIININRNVFIIPLLFSKILSYIYFISLN